MWKLEIDNEMACLISLFGCAYWSHPATRSFKLNVDALCMLIKVLLEWMQLFVQKVILSVEKELWFNAQLSCLRGCSALLREVK